MKTPSFPHWPTALDVRWEPRRPYAGILNLKSCELQHPEADRLVLEAAARLSAADLRSYPHQDVILNLLANYHGVSPGYVMLTAGSDGAVGLLVDALARPAGRLVLAEPNFEGWRHYAGLRGVPVTAVTTLSGTPPVGDLTPLADAMAAARGSAVVSIANPGSPSGLVTDSAEVYRLAELAERHGHLLVVDECFGEFVDVTHAPLLERFDHLVIIHSYSKTFALAGVRIAAVLACPELLDYLTRFRPDSAVSATGVAMLTQMIGHADRFREVWRDVRLIRGHFVAAVLSAHPTWSVLDPGGNFATFSTGRPEIPPALVRHLAEQRIRIRSLTDLPGLRGCVRFSLASDANMHTVAAQVAAFHPP